LKLSATPFCQGLPGSINAVPMPCTTIQVSSALETDVDRQPLLGELVGHGQALELLTVGAVIEHSPVQ
jgi:hypothetical protein